MQLSQDLLAILACPRCKQKLTAAVGGMELDCDRCRVGYPVQDGIPVLLPEESRVLTSGTDETRVFADTAIDGEKVRFRVVEGKNKGETIELPIGSCRAIGRSLDEPEKTRVVSVDYTIGLDDFSKKLVIGYISKQFKKGEGAASGGGEQLGAFCRERDVYIKDVSISRLHAMFFYDQSGVGILDLVSKNGTFVNGVEVESKLLKKGDLIQVGSTKLILE